MAEQKINETALDARLNSIQEKKSELESLLKESSQLIEKQNLK